MGNRTLIEVAHDLSYRVKADPLGFVDAMTAFLASNSPRNADQLKLFGFNVIGTRHHSDFYEVHYGGHYATEGKRMR